VVIVLTGEIIPRAAKIKIKAAASLEISALTLKALMLESPVKDLKVRW